MKRIFCANCGRELKILNDCYHGNTKLCYGCGLRVEKIDRQRRLLRCAYNMGASGRSEDAFYKWLDEIKLGKE